MIRFGYRPGARRPDSVRGPRPRTFDGAHCTEWVGTVKQLCRDGNVDATERILLGCVAATQAGSSADDLSVAPWDYEQLAILYPSDGRDQDEVAVLESFAKQRHAASVKPRRLLERLDKARERMQRG